MTIDKICEMFDIFNIHFIPLKMKMTECCPLNFSNKMKMKGQSGAFFGGNSGSKSHPKKQSGSTTSGLFGAPKVIDSVILGDNSGCGIPE